MANPINLYPIRFTLYAVAARTYSEVRMFGDILAEVRKYRGLSVARIARRAGTSRAAVASYESGAKQPQFDTAERTLKSMGYQLIAAPAAPPSPRIKPPEQVIERLEGSKTSPEAAVELAWAQLSQILESDAELEHLGFSWGEVLTIAEGVTIAGDPLLVDRAYTLRRSIVESLEAAAAGAPAPLSIVGEYAVQADSRLSAPALEIDFLVRAAESHADLARSRHLAGASLASHGYPYLWVTFQAMDQYRRGVVSCRRTGDASGMLTALAESITGVSQQVK